MKLLTDVSENLQNMKKKIDAIKMIAVHENGESFDEKRDTDSETKLMVLEKLKNPKQRETVKNLLDFLIQSIQKLQSFEEQISNLEVHITTTEDDSSKSPTSSSSVTTEMTKFTDTTTETTSSSEETTQTTSSNEEVVPTDATTSTSTLSSTTTTTDETSGESTNMTPIGETTTDSSTSECYVDFIKVEKKCYQLVTEPANYLAAITGCIKNGAVLASIESQMEQDYVSDLASTSGAWIGLQDFLNEGTFTWVDKSPVNFTNWRANQPNNNNNNQHCTWVRPDGKWDDVLCNKEQAYLCQKSRS